MRVTILADGDVLHVSEFGTRGIETSFYGEGGKSAVMFLAVEPFFRNRKKNFSVFNDRGGRIGVKHIQAKNQHEMLAFSSPLAFPFIACGDSFRGPRS